MQPKRQEQKLVNFTGNYTPRMPVTFLVLHVTELCNLRCVYCYERDQLGYHGKAMEIKTAIASVDWLIHNSGEMKELRLVFFGGEPLMNFPVIQDSVEYANQVAQQTGKRIRYDISTNGTLLNREIIGFFKKHRIVPTISMDGPRYIQDIQRPFKNGKGSYNQATRWIAELLTEIPQTGCNAILLNGNDHDKVMEELKGLGFKKISISSPNSLSRARQRFLSGHFEQNNPGWNTRELRKNADRLLRYIKARDIAGVRSVVEISNLIGMVELLVKKILLNRPCGAGRSSFAVSADGDLYPCHRFNGMTSFRLGSVNNPALEKYFNPRNVLDENPACRKCNAWPLCGGGCFHDNFISTGSLTIPSEAFCTRMRTIFSIWKKLADALDDSDLLFLFRGNLFFPEDCTLDFSDARQHLRKPGKNMSRYFHLEQL